MTAVLSADGVYRYELWRMVPLPLGEDRGTVAFCMLNPSTADATLDDPTIRRCTYFARRWGYSRLAVCNLYARRATQPGNLFGRAPEARGDCGLPSSPEGLENRWHIERIIQDSSLQVAAWGVGGHGTPAAAWVLARASWRCLGTTKGGAPRHPLYVAAATPLVPYP